VALESSLVFFGLQACLLAFPGGFPVVSGRLSGCLVCMLPLCLIAGVFAVRTGLKTRQVRLFFWNKTPYFGALFLGLRSYSFPKQSAFSSYGETVAAPTLFVFASPGSQRLGVFAQRRAARKRKTRTVFAREYSAA